MFGFKSLLDIYSVEMQSDYLKDKEGSSVSVVQTRS